MMRREAARAEMTSAADELARSDSPDALARLQALSAEPAAEDLADDGPARFPELRGPLGL
jgi:hypothetical protein